MRYLYPALILFTAFIACFTGYSQTQPVFFKFYQNFSGHSFIQTPDGGFILAGVDTIFSSPCNAALVKTDSMGVVEWSKLYGGSEIDYFQDVIQTYNHDFVLSGVKYNNGVQDMYIVKTDSSGDTLWTRVIGDAGVEYLRGAVETADSNLLFVGVTTGNIYGTAFIKMDQFGNIIWSKVYQAPGGYYIVPKHIERTLDNGFIISGQGDDFYLLKIDSAGNVLWDKMYNYNMIGSDAFCVKQTSDSGYIVCGILREFGNSYEIMEVFKTDPTGNIIWQYAYGENSMQGGSIASDIDMLADGSITIGGLTYSYGAIQKMLMNISPSGNVVNWAKTYSDGGASSLFHTSRLLNDGSYAIIGQLNMFANDSFFLARTNSIGEIGCEDSSVVPNVYTTSLQTSVANGITSPAAFIIGNFATQILPYNNPAETTVCLDLNTAEENALQSLLNIFPNPAHDFFTISLVENISGSTLEIFNSTGFKVYAGLFESEQKEMNIELAAGIYHVVLSDQKKRMIGKLVVY